MAHPNASCFIRPQWQDDSTGRTYNFVRSKADGNWYPDPRTPMDNEVCARLKADIMALPEGPEKASMAHLLKYDSIWCVEHIAEEGVLG